MEEAVFLHRVSRFNGSAFKVTRGKGATRAASVHQWADDEPLLQVPFAMGGGPGAGAGAGACLVSAACLEFLPLSVALASRFMPAGPMLFEAQGQLTAAAAAGHASRLAVSVKRRGGECSETSEIEAAAAGASAVVEWRNGADLDGGELGARGVSWRAVVGSIKRDSLGESIEHWRAGDDYDSLTGSALPLPQLLGDASRDDKASRLLFERARAGRGSLLARRIDSLLRLGGRGQRAELVGKVHRAAVLLLHGSSLDQAAAAAGFNASGRCRAGDRFAQALRRLGLRVRFNLRQPDGARERAGAGGPFVPMSAATAAGWSFLPSAGLRGEDGRWGKRLVPALRRLQRGRARRARLASAQALRARLASRQGARRAARLLQVERAQVRAWKSSGDYYWRPLSSVGNGFWRGASR